ncbi:RNA-guided endonuclease TnpB family protein [Deinococcus sp. S9]|uniref:RNA-guided endonuclease InsQ/TnpB family protein n=1 Tax=Deinococcus sp. S9 TaxID=2545754 RepID=UPI001054AF2C|nr:RNA-guided endonuclease TnpB family protein [Deinococcus sp. S9]TDE87353.1 transposase [Deinococcus sp. S9]
MPVLAHKIRLFPTEEQAVSFERAAGVARFTYNWALAECNRVRAETGKNPKMADLKKKFNGLKGEQFPWIYDSPKDANQQPFTNLQKAWKRFWYGVKKEGKIPVWSRAQKKKLLAEGVKPSKMSFAPTFKRKKDGASFYVSNDKFSLFGKMVKLPVVGVVQMAECLRFEGKVMSGTVSKYGGHWFLSVQVEVQDRDYFRFRSDDGIAGIDLGVKDTAIIVNGIQTEKATGPKPLKKALRRLAIRQRRVSRKRQAQLEKMGLKGKAIPKGTKIPKSNNQLKAESAVTRIHARVKNVRSDFQHKLTNRLCSENQAIAIEDLSIAGMMQNKKLSRAIADIGMGEIRRQIQYKALRYGTQIVLVDRWYPSSKTCSGCGWKKEDLKLSDREWVCEGCGTIHDRDENAGINLRNKVFEVFPDLLPAGSPESHARADMTGGCSSQAGNFDLLRNG